MEPRAILVEITERHKGRAGREEQGKAELKKFKATMAFMAGQASK